MNSFFRATPLPIDTTPQQAFEQFSSDMYAYVNADHDEKLRAQAVRAFGESTSPFANTPEDYTAIGRALVAEAGYPGIPEAYYFNTGKPLPENWLNRYELYQHLGKDLADSFSSHYKQEKARVEALIAKQAKTLQDGIPSLAQELAKWEAPSAKTIQAFTDAEMGDRIHTIIGDVSEALRYVRGFQSLNEADIETEVESLKQQERSSREAAIARTVDLQSGGSGEYKYLHDDDYYRQQAIANTHPGYNFSREQIRTLLSVLADESGKVDPAAMSLFVATLDEKVNQEKTIESAFWRNVVAGMRDFFTDTADFATRASKALNDSRTPVNFTPGISSQPSVSLSDSAFPHYKELYSGDVETLRGFLRDVHDNALSPADKAQWLAGTSTRLGSVVGSNAVPTAASLLVPGSGAAGFIAQAGTYATTLFPSAASRSISSAYAEGKAANPEAQGLFIAAAESAAESLFGAVGAVPGVQNLSRTALDFTFKSSGALARAAGAVQSRAYLRYAFASAGETAGELFVEDNVANAIETIGMNVINRAAGRDIFHAPEFTPIRNVMEACKDSQQVVAVATYCSLLGALGFGGDAAKAREFSRNLDNLLSVGYPQSTAINLSRRAEQATQQAAEIAADKSLTAEQKADKLAELDHSFAETSQKLAFAELLNASHDELKARFEAQNRSVMEKAEALHFIQSGAADAVLKKANILKTDITPDGKRALTLPVTTTKADGSEEYAEETVELSESQYRNYVATLRDAAAHQAMVDYQNALLGNAAVRKARSADSIRDELVNLRDLAAVAPAYQHIANKGYIDYDGTLLIAQAARETRDKLVAQGMTIEQANAAPDPLTGAAIGSLANLPSAFTQRVTDATDTSEGRASGISPQNAASAALRLPSAKSLGDSVVLYVSGESTLSDMAEELVESDLVRALDSGRVTLPTLRDNLLALQSELRAYDPDFKILPSKAPQDISFQNIAEAYSTLQHFDLLTRADRFALSPTSKAIIRYTLANTEVARNLRTAADAWATFANSEQGQTFLSTSGKTLSDLLDAAGIAQSKLFSDLRVEEADRIAADAAANFSLETLAAEEQAELDTAAEAADTATATNTDLPRTEIPAEDSATGEPITVDPLETADYNPAKEPSEQPEQSGGNAFGITSALLPPSSLQPHPALSGTPTIRNSSIVNRNSKFNPNSKPILALRMPDGQHLIVSGRTRHAIALADPTCKTVKVTLINYDPTIHTDDWVLMTNAGEHITARTATTEHYRTYFTLNPITHAQAIEQGLVPIDPATGQPTAAYIKGRQEAEHTLASKAEADAAAAAEAAAAAKAKAEKSLPGQTKWSTPAKKSKPLSDSETKQTLISVAGKTVSSDGLRPVLSLVTIQRKKGTEYTVSTDARRLTVLSRSTTAPDTESDTEEFYDAKGVQYKRGDQPYPNWRQTIPLVSKHQASTTIDLSYYSFLAKGSVKGGYTKRIDSPFFRDGQHIFFNIGNHRAAINPVFMRDIYKQMQQLGKKLGFPPTLKAYYFEEKVPLIFTAEHNGITYQSLVMPQRVHALDENGNKIREGGNYVYKTPDLTPGDIILGQQPSIYGQQDTGSFSIRANLRENISLAANRKMKSNNLVALCSCPTVLQMMGEKNVGVVTTAQTIRKMHTTHGLSEETIYTAIEKLDEPAYVFKDKEGSYVFIPGVIAKNAKGNDSDIEIPIILERAKDGSHYVASAYALDDFQKIESWIKNGKLVYAKTLQAQPSTNGAREVTPNFEHLVVGLSSTDNLLTGTDLVNFKFAAQGISDSYPSQQETLVSSLSLRRPTARNYATILRERDATLLRVSNYIKRHAQRTARVIGADTDKKRAGVAFAQANAIIAALDKYIFARELINRSTPEYRRLTSLRSLLESFVTTAQKGKLPARRNTKAGELTTAQETRIAIEQMIDATLSERSAAAMPEEGTPTMEELVTTLAADNAEQVISTMLDLMGDIIETHLRNSILDRMATSLRSLRPRHTAAGRVVRNIIDADTQRKLTLTEHYLNLTPAERENINQQFENQATYLDQLREILDTDHATPQAIAALPDTVVKTAYNHIAAQGGAVTLDRVQDEVLSMQRTFDTYAYLDQGTMQDALTAYLALNNMVRNSRFEWDTKTAADRAARDTYITEAIAAVPQYKADIAYRMSQQDSAIGSFLDSFMSIGQLFEALSGTDGFRSVARDTLSRIANASPAILNARKEINHTLVEAYLRLYKPAAYAKLPTNTAERHKALQRHLEGDYNAFIVDLQKPIHTGINLEHQLAPSVQAVRDAQGDTAPQDFGQELVLTKGEILNLILSGEQQEYQKNLIYHGYTEEVQSQLRAIIGSELLEFGHTMRALLMNSGVAEVYAERTGHHLPDNPNYWPIHIDHITHTKGEASPDENKFRAAPTDSFLRRRVVSMGAIKPMDAMLVFQSNIAGRHNYIYMQPIVDTWNSLMANPHFAHRLEGTIGSERLKKLRTGLDLLVNAAWGDTQLHGAFAKFCSFVQSGRAISLLSGNLGTLVRQLTALNHVGIQLPSGTAAYAKWALLAAQGKTRLSVADMLQTDTFRARMQGNPYFEELLRDGKKASWNTIKQTAKSLTGKGMDAIAAVDAAANAFAATVLYNIRYDQYANSGKGYTDTEIHNLSMQDVNIMMELVAQPLLQHQKSLAMATTQHALLKMMGFMATEMLNKIGMARARYLKAGGGVKGCIAYTRVASAIGIPASVIGILLTAAADDLPDDQVDIWAYLTSQALQGVSGLSVLFNLPMIGDYMSTLFQPSYYNKSEWANLLPGVGATTAHFGKLLTMSTTNNSWSNAEYVKVVNQCSRDLAAWTRLIERILPNGYTSTVSACAAALAAGSNMTRLPSSILGTLNRQSRIEGKEHLRKRAYSQPAFERYLSGLYADADYEKRKATAKRERTRATRKANRQAKQQAKQ